MQKFLLKNFFLYCRIWWMCCTDSWLWTQLCKHSWRLWVFL